MVAIDRKKKTKSGLVGLTYHDWGNYCGPNWNQGKYQGSAVRDSSSPRPIDDYDNTCAIHDDAYAINKNLKEADYKFFWDNIGQLGTDIISTFKRNRAALAVGLQGLTRGNDPQPLSSSKLMEVDLPPTSTTSRKRSRSTSFSQNSRGFGTQTMKLRSGKLVVRPKKSVSFKKRKTLKRKGKGKRKSRKGKKSGYKIKKRVKKNIKYSIKGAILKVESGGVFQSGSYKTLYLGHGCSPRKVRESAIRAIYKELYKRAGVVIQDWVNYYPIQPNGFQKILVELCSSTAPSTYTTISYDVDLTKTYNDNAIALATKLETDMSSNAYTVYLIRLLCGEIAGNPNNYSERATIRGDEINLDFEITSEIRIQNRTQAKDIIDGTQEGTEEQYTSITNNPLIGRMYQTKKWSTGFQTSGRGNNVASGNAFQVTGDYGTISAGPSISTSLGAVPDNIYQKPPPAWVFGAKDLGKVLIEPGQIKKAYFKFNAKISLNNLLNKCPFMFTVNTDGLQPFGKCQMVALEKLLDDRNESTINIAISYELNQQYKCAFIKKRPATSIPILEVNTTANNVGPEVIP